MASRLLLVLACGALITSAATIRTRGVTAPPAVPRADTIRRDSATGLALDARLPLVRAHCTPCHSSKLILQSHLSREEWVGKIRWMQRTQKLWDLGEAEPAILDYLVAYHGPLVQPFDGRRLPLATPRWYRPGS